MTTHENNKIASDFLASYPTQSPEIDKIFMAFAKCQAVVSKAEKSTENKHLNTRYADLESVCDAILTAVKANDLFVIQSPTFVPGIPETTMTLETFVGHANSGQFMRRIMAIPLPTRLDDHIKELFGKGGIPKARPELNAQTYGAALTYARRYALASFFGVVQSDDDAQSLAVQASRGDVTEFKRFIEEAESIDKVKEIYKHAMARFGNDATGVTILTNAKNRRAAELATESATPIPVKIQKPTAVEKTAKVETTPTQTEDDFI